MITALLLVALLDFGPERELVARPPAGLAPRARERARVATSHSGSLVIWSDGRTGEWNVYGARLDRAGTLLDENGLVIASGIAGDVVWTGNAYLVAYALHPIVYVRAVTPEGTVGDPIPIVRTDWVAAHTVRLATDGETVLLMTNSGRGAVLTLDGEKRRELDVGITHYHEFSLDIAVGNDAYGLATIVENGVAFRRIRADSDDAAQVLPGTRGATTVALGSDGTGFLAVFDSTGGLRAQRVSDAAARNLTSFAAAYPTVVWRGSEYLITFSRTANIDALAVRASASGEPLGEPVMFAAATPPSLPDADRRPDGTGVAAWVTGSRVEVGFFDSADAAPSEVAPISFSAPEQQFVRVGARGIDVFTMWLESGAVRLGRGPGGPAVTVATGEVWPLDVLIDGDVVWAVWNEYPRGVFVRRYTSGLVPIDDAPVVAMSSENSTYEDSRNTQIAAGGGSLVLVAANGHRESGVFANVVREVNGELAVQFHFLPTWYLSRLPVVAWNGSEFVIAWANAQDLTEWWATYIPDHLVMQRIGADGVLRDAVPVTISSEPRSISAIKAVRSGNDVALVWQSSPLAPATFTRETFAAHVSSPEAHAVGNPLDRRLRAVTTVGDQVLLLWTKEDVEYVLLSEELAEVDRGAVPIPAAPFSLATTGTRPVLGYSRVAEEHGRVLRAFVRTTVVPRNRAVRR